MEDSTAGTMRRELRVVIASPRDVLKERDIARRAIERVNVLLKSMKKDYYLEAIDHRTTIPGVGNPHDVSQDHLQIKTSDFFVCIFGHRFGDPPGKRRPEDGSEVKSGTEDEFETAYKTNKENPNNRPRVMVYRKKDPLPPNLSDEEIIQYASLLNFIQECGPSGRHPTYVAEYKLSELENLLIDHFLEACSEMEMQEKDERVQLNNDWYRLVGLRENPFAVDIFSQDFPEEYLIQFAGIEWQQYRNLLENINTIYTFGERGSGKSTLREKIKRKASKNDLGKKILVCSLRAGHFDNSIERAGGKLTDFQDWVFAYMIFDKVVNKLVTGSETSSQPALKDVHSSAGTLQDLIDWIQKETDYRNILVLVDEVDEIKLVKESSAPIQAIYGLLYAMAGLPKIDNIIIRYFLPAKVEALLMEQEPERFRLMEKNPAVHLTWTEDKLLELISQRISVASKGRLVSLSQVYSGSQTNVSIDMELVRLAECNPRAALHLADRLLELHVSQPRPLPDTIQQSTWEKVKFAWQGERKSFFPPKPLINPFNFIEHGVRFKGVVYRLSKTHTHLIAPLIRSYGSHCSREILNQAGWPEDKEPPSEKNFYETMGNLTKEVNKFAPGWLTNTRGLGYKLEDPGLDAENKEGTKS